MGTGESAGRGRNQLSLLAVSYINSSRIMDVSIRCSVDNLSRLRLESN